MEQTSDNSIKEELEFVPDEEGDTPELQQKIKKIKTDLKKCGAERKEYLEGWQRAKADFINYKNDEGKRLEDMARFITAGLIQEFLPVLDSFDLALHSLQLSLSGSPQQENKGILLVYAQLMGVLKKRGLEEIAVREGEEFNPEKHESIGETESSHPAGNIAETVQKGYTSRGRVLRPARVRIAK